jgi:phospholipid-translocating ATPase
MDLFLALILCHNVTPVYPEPPREASGGQEDDNNDQDDPQNREASSNKDIYFVKKEFQAASPDEIALVKYAEEMGMVLLQREEKFIQIEDSNGHQHTYDILENFPFSSDTKRMGIILKNRQTKQIMFYLKGAETVMEIKTRPNQRDSLRENCEQLAQDGLRTLVITQKELKEDRYDDFRYRYSKAKTSLHQREDLMQQAVESIEESMEFLAVTGVEDKLQEKVLETIEKVRSAKI